MHPHPQIWRPLALLSAVVAATLFATTTISIAPGDALSEIAERHDVTVAQLLDWNDLDDPDRIVAGATLIVSASESRGGPAVAGSDTHVVTAGDTLSAIAARFGTSIAGLVTANSLADPDRIHVGQTLHLTNARPATTTTAAPARTHTVGTGDTLSTIAAKYGVKTGTLAADNDIADPDRIMVGLVLTIGTPSPSSDSTPSTASPPRPAPMPPTPVAPPGGQVFLAPIFARWAQVYDVPQDLLEAIAWAESDWNPAMAGAGGRLGIMQLGPSTVDMIESGLLGRSMDPLDADNSLQMGARFLRYLLDRTSSEREAVAAWRQGLTGVLTDGVNTNGAGYADTVEEIRRHRR